LPPFFVDIEPDRGKAPFMSRVHIVCSSSENVLWDRVLYDHEAIENPFGQKGRLLGGDEAQIKAACHHIKRIPLVSPKATEMRSKAGWVFWPGCFVVRQITAEPLDPIVVVTEVGRFTLGKLGGS